MYLLAYVQTGKPLTQVELDSHVDRTLDPVTYSL
jgi:hypothetical protein